MRLHHILLTGAALMSCGVSLCTAVAAPIATGPSTPTSGAPAPNAIPAARAAAPAAAPTSADKLAEARMHFQQGVALYQEQNYDAALAEFDGAYRVSAEPLVLYNTGLTYKALFRYAEAVDTLERYLSESVARGQMISKDRRAEVEKIVTEMKSLLADVTVMAKPANAAVRVDGRPITLGIEGIVKLAAGSHTIDASAADYTAEKREIVVVGGTPQKVSFALVAIPRTGRVRITAAQIGAKVSIDGRDRGPAPVEIDLLAGGHQVEVTAPGYAASRSELVVAAGQSRQVTIGLELPQAAPDDSPFYHRWWFWTGVGVAAAATGTVLLLPHPTQAPVSGTLGIAGTNL